MYIFWPTTPQDFETYYEIRWRILRQPWHQPRGSERDAFEKQSRHVMVHDANHRPIAVGRVHFPKLYEAQIRYMAVELGDRHRGAGRLTLDSLEQYAREQGARIIFLNARIAVIDFYKKMGYQVTGKAHTLFGAVRHVRMQKRM